MKNEFNETFFYKLTKAEAQLFLDNFLTEAKRGFEQLIPEIQQKGLGYEFRLDNIEPLFRYYVSRAESIAKNPDLSLPEFIRKSSTYKENLFDFDDGTQANILRLAYFVGTSFIKTYPQLSWGIGDSNSALENRPVIKGFKFDKELPVYDVANNSFRKLFQKNKFTFVEVWQNNV